MKVNICNPNYYEIASYTVTVFLPGQHTFNIPFATTPSDAVSYVRERVYHRKQYPVNLDQLHLNLCLVKHNPRDEAGFFTAQISEFPIPSSDIESTWVKLVDDYKRDPCRTTAFVNNYEISPVLPLHDMPSYKVIRLLPRRYEYDIKAASNPIQAIAIARHISYRCRKKGPFISYENLKPSPYVVINKRTGVTSYYIAQATSMTPYTDAQIGEAFQKYIRSSK